MLKDYVLLTKPGIIMGNLIAACSGYFLASQGSIQFGSLLAVALGTSLVIASGCVFNNYIDRDIDSKMQRTQNRGFVTGLVNTPKSMIYGAFLGMIGITILHIFTNWWAVFFACLGYFVYVCVYSLKYKRASVYGTLIGSLSGACPPVIGYVAVSNQFDAGAAILLVTYCLWQIPHSYAIAIYRFDDYRNANIPVLPVEKGLQAARKHMVAYIGAFAVAAMLLTARGYTGYVFALVIGLMSMYWLYIAKTGYQISQERQWGKRLFIMSIVMISVYSVLISVDYVEQSNIHQIALN